MLSKAQTFCDYVPNGMGLLAFETSGYYLSADPLIEHQHAQKFIESGLCFIFLELIFQIIFEHLLSLRKEFTQ